MNLSLRARLVIAHGLVVLLALSTFLVMASREQRRWLVARNVESLEQLANLVLRDLRRDHGQASWPMVVDSLDGVYHTRITLMARDGRVLADSDVAADQLAAVENHAGRPEMRAALAGRSGHASRRSRTVGVELLYVAIPATVGNVSVLRLAEPLTIVTSLNRSLLTLSISAATIALVLSLFVVYWVVGHHTARVRELEEVASRAGRGQAVRAREQPADELGRLGQALNRMTAELGRRLETLERERDERERILAHMTDGVVLLDRDGHVLRANRSLATILGVDAPPPAGTPFREFVRAPELDELLTTSRERLGTVVTELRIWSPHQRLIRATATPAGAGDDASTVIVLQDLTEAERLNRVRQDFVANVSHELRTPITSLRGYAETLLEGGLADVVNRESFVRIIRDQAARLAALVDDLLTLADLERPGTPIDREPLDLRKLAERQVEAFGPAAEQAGLGLHLEPGPALPMLGDASRLEQVIANLLDNAVKYSDHGQVTVRLGEDPDGVWCEVADQGRGIPEEDQPRIFERFYRVDKARSREKGGTGLGLSIVKHIVALHRGEVSLTSHPATGSTFRFSLPRA